MKKQFLLTSLILIGTSGLLVANVDLKEVEAIKNAATAKQKKFEDDLGLTESAESPPMYNFANDFKELIVKLLETIKRRMGTSEQPGNKQLGIILKNKILKEFKIEAGSLDAIKLDLTFLKKHYSLVGKLMGLERTVANALQAIDRNTNSYEYLNQMTVALRKFSAEQKRIKREAATPAQPGKSLIDFPGKEAFKSYFQHRKADYKNKIKTQHGLFIKKWELITPTTTNLSPSEIKILRKDYDKAIAEATHRGKITKMLKLPLFDTWKKSISKSYEKEHKQSLKTDSEARVSDINSGVADQRFDGMMKNLDEIYRKAFQMLDNARKKIPKHKKKPLPKIPGETEETPQEEEITALEIPEEEENIQEDDEDDDEATTQKPSLEKMIEQAKKAAEVPVAYDENLVQRTEYDEFSKETPFKEYLQNREAVYKNEIARRSEYSQRILGEIDIATITLTPAEITKLLQDYNKAMAQIVRPGKTDRHPLLDNWKKAVRKTIKASEKQYKKALRVGETEAKKVFKQALGPLGQAESSFAAMFDEFRERYEEAFAALNTLKSAATLQGVTNP